MTAYLELYGELWSQVLQPEDHEHEVGEDTERCVNCQLDAIERKMSAFESASFNWYFENVTRFTRETGMVGDLIRSERLAPTALKLFMRALGKLYKTMDKIAGEQVKAEPAGEE